MTNIPTNGLLCISSGSSIKLVCKGCCHERGWEGGVDEMWVDEVLIKEQHLGFQRGPPP